jgi:hypothetical protein
MCENLEVKVVRDVEKSHIYQNLGKEKNFLSLPEKVKN